MSKPWGKPHFATRTVRGGAVRIMGETFRPQGQHLAYDGRLEGKRLIFGLYWWAGEWQRDFVEGWGTPEMHKATTEEEIRAAHDADPLLIDGRYPWSFWDRDGRVPR